MSVYSLKKKTKYKRLYSDFTKENKGQLRTKIAQTISAQNIKEHGDSISSIRKLLMQNLVDQYFNARYLSSDLNSSYVYQLLSVWADNNAPIDHPECQLKLLAILIARKTQHSLKFKLSIFSHMLAKASHVLMLEDCISMLRNINGLGAIQITKHGIAPKGILVQQATDVMKILTRMMTELTEMNYEPCLAYGTLLGAYRDKQFIAHDDDVDILIKLSDEDLDIETVEDLRDKFLEKLDKTRYRIDYGNLANLNVHIYDIETNIMIDIFPYWYDKDQAILYMENMNTRGIARDILDGRQMIEFYGESLAAPAKIEAFLEERYGESWNVLDPFHEWPLKLQIDTKQDTENADNAQEKEPA